MRRLLVRSALFWPAARCRPSRRADLPVPVVLISGVAWRPGGVRPDDPGARSRRAHRPRFRPVRPGAQALAYAPTADGQHIPEVAGRVVAPAIEAALARAGYPPGAPVDIVGYSMGGLVARYLIEKAGWACRVGTVVMLGTPNHGTIAAWVPGTIGGFGRWNATGGDMRPGSPFLRSLGYGRTGRRALRRHRRRPVLAPVPLRRAGPLGVAVPGRRRALPRPRPPWRPAPRSAGGSPDHRAARPPRRPGLRPAMARQPHRGGHDPPRVRRDRRRPRPLDRRREPLRHLGRPRRRRRRLRPPRRDRLRARRPLHPALGRRRPDRRPGGAARDEPPHRRPPRPDRSGPLGPPGGRHRRLPRRDALRRPRRHGLLRSRRPPLRRPPRRLPHLPQRRTASAERAARTADPSNRP